MPLPAAPIAKATPAAAPDAGALLRVVDLTRRFGGLVAVNHVSLALRLNEIHAVIGTNGAGKSTLINMLSGEIATSSGQILLDGRDVSHWSQPRRALAGIGRSYQRTTIFPAFSVFENCRLAAQATHQHAWKVWQSAQRCGESTAAAQAALHATGLAAHTARLAGTLAHGQQRQLEIAMCLATHPRVLLLDEPLAGMGAEETERMLELLEGLRQTHAILLVEHDMDAIFRVADCITVMVDGAVIASATPEAVRGNDAVREAYLGTAF